MSDALRQEYIELAQRVDDAARSNATLDDVAERLSALESAVAEKLSVGSGDIVSLRDLNRDVQCLCGKLYMRQHHVPRMLDGMVQHALRSRPAPPVDAMLAFLDTVSSD